MPDRLRRKVDRPLTSTNTPTALVPAMMDHLLAPLRLTRKQFSFEPFQVVQKPSWRKLPGAFASSAPALPIGSRVILPSAANTILNLTFDSVDAVNGLPLKNVLSISFGASRPAGAAKATAVAASRTTTPPIAARIESLRIETRNYRQHTSTRRYARWITRQAVVFRSVR